MLQTSYTLKLQRDPFKEAYKTSSFWVFEGFRVFKGFRGFSGFRVFGGFRVFKGLGFLVA